MRHPQISPVCFSMMPEDTENASQSLAIGSGQSNLKESCRRSYLQRSEIFEQLVFYFKYASSAYTLLCPKPNGNHLVSPVREIMHKVKSARFHRNRLLARPLMAFKDTWPETIIGRRSSLLSVEGEKTSSRASNGV